MKRTRKWSRNGLRICLRCYFWVSSALLLETDPFRGVSGPSSAGNRPKNKVNIIIFITYSKRGPARAPGQGPELPDCRLEVSGRTGPGSSRTGSGSSGAGSGSSRSLGGGSSPDCDGGSGGRQPPRAVFLSTETSLYPDVDPSPGYTREADRPGMAGTWL